MEVAVCRWRFLAVLTVFLYTIAARINAKPLQTDLSSLSSQELQYYFGRNTGVPEHMLLNSNHLRRERRSTDDSATLRYTLEAFEENFDLLLQQTKNLFNAGTLVHRIGASGVPNISSPERHCYFTGVSQNHDNSKVLLSTCNGLHGTIVINSAEFVIQPLKEEHIDQENDAAPNHLMYKKPDIVSSSSCTSHEDRPTENTINERRRKDATDEPKHIETSVVVDDQMYATYGESTENYVLSILNQVSGLLKDSSLDADIVLHINKITIIEEPQKTLDLSDELDQSLNNFCDWQKDEQSDVSLLITGRDLATAGNKDVAGKAADVGGACNPGKRCIITEDHGPSGLVFTAAHEIGHSIGMYHDGGFSDCPNKKNIMASLNSGGSDAFHWSQCSNTDLNNFLSSPESSCLDNAPLGMPEYDIDSAPMAGFYINATRQCQMTYGSEATAAVKYADTKEMCKALRCDFGKVEGVTNSVPPLDGTSCGTSRREVCMRGSCMKVYSTYDCDTDASQCTSQWLEGAWETCIDCMQQRTVLCVEIVDSTTRLRDESTCPPDKPITQRDCCTTEQFQFTSGPYGACSVTCGDGIESRTVVCQDTTTQSTVSDSMCTGVRPVATQPCFLQACTIVSSFSYVIGQFGLCSVTCGTGVQSRSVTCVDANQAVVATSNCVSAGLGTVPTTQACITGIACPPENIYRYVTGPLSSCSVTCGTGIQTRTVMCMNQNNVIVSESFCVAQSLSRPGETVVCTLQACEQVIDFRYITGSFGACTVTCGTGVQTRSVTCVNANDITVSDAFCINLGLAQPSTTQLCTLAACSSTFQFVTGEYGSCSTTCGVGVQTRGVFCINENSVSVGFQQCLDAGLITPETTTVCTGEPCPGEVVYTYSVTDFSECSVTCGEGFELRIVTCEDNNGNIVDDANCVNAGLTRPDETRMCFLVDCTTYSYFIGEFGACPVTCGDGIQIRVVECRNDETGAAVADAFCSEEKPSNLQQCATNACDAIFEYVVGPYGTCSCDGVQTRVVLCVERVGTSLDRADDSECVNAGLTRPSATGVCDPPPSCDGPTWSTTAFGECSVTCGVGVQTRLVFCVEAPDSQVIVDDALCNSDLIPASTQPCDTEVECPNQYIWLFSEWGTCSVTCGEGVETRSVTCYSLADALVTEVDPSFCPAGEEPAAVRECSGPPCNGAWQTTDWSVCSISCGCGGIRTRNVGCYTFKGSGIATNESECIAEDRPTGTEDCYLGECPSPYGCDQTYDAEIGTTYQLRSPNYPNNYPSDLTCDQDYVGVINIAQSLQVDEEYTGGIKLAEAATYHVEITFTDFDVEYSPNCEFDYLEIIDVQGSNSVKLCGTLNPLPYVYRSDGPELQISFVSDSTNNRRGFDATYEIVPNEGVYYVTGDFGECSVSCGSGIQTRTVTCYENEVVVEDSECASLDRPASTQPCNEGECPGEDGRCMAKHRVGATRGPGAHWTPCSTTPGYTSSLRSCLAEVIRTEPGTLTSPNFPSNYTSNSTCANTIIAPLGKVIQIDVLFFQLQDSEDCAADALIIDDVNTAELAVRFCSVQNTASTLFLSDTNEVKVTFATDLTVEDSGYSVSYSFVDPTRVLCGGIIQNNNQPIYSPGYPGNYSDDESCQVTIISGSGCVELTFLDVHLVEGCADYIDVNDQNSDVVDQVICADTDVSRVWHSASNFVRVTFISDSVDTDIGYIANVGFADCYAGTWVVGPWTECSVTCDEGVETRSVVCRDAITNAVADGETCPEEKPEESRDCVLEECPSCDQLVTTSGVVLDYPEADTNYGNNEECVTTIVNEAGCISLIFLDVDIQPGTTMGICDRDYLEVVDVGNPALSFRVCGTTRPANFQSVSGTVELRFHSDNIVTADGYSVYPNFNACPSHAFIPGNWSECDVTCAIGSRYREVPCIAIADGSVVSDELCPGVKPATNESCEQPECPSCNQYFDSDGELVLSENYPSNYSANVDCVYTFNNTDDELDTCILLRFLEVDLDPANDDGECEDDYLEAVDLNYPQLTTRICGIVSGNPPEWLSRSREVELRFHTNEEGTGNGFYVYESFVPCSPFGFVAGEFGECSVTCGGGVRTRDVDCVTLSLGNVVDKQLCSDPEPIDSEDCGEEECPSCNFEIGNQQIFSSENYPNPYAPNQDCTYTITNPEGCVSVLFLELKLEEPNALTNECHDFVEISDNSTDLLTIRYCGGTIPPVWRSRSGFVNVRFFSDEQNEAEGFSIYPQYATCPQFGYVTQAFGECSVTCGEGSRLRQVNCVNLVTEMIELDESRCTDTKPATSEPCILEPCPSCNLVVNQTGSVVDSPNYPDTYENNQECVYSIESLNAAQCVRLFFILFELPEPEDGECSDYILIEEYIPGYSRDVALCGSRTPFPYEALSDHVDVTFISDENITSAGFQMYTSFQNCPDYGFLATEWSECTVTCGEGTQTRSVICYDTDNEVEVDASFCGGLDPLATERECEDLPDCPLCIFEIDKTNELITAPGFPNDYLPNQNCIYNIVNNANNGCIRLNFLYFELTGRTGGACNDFLTVDDVNDNDPEPLEFCEREAPMTWDSQSNNVVLNFVSDDTGTEGGFTILTSFQDCPDPPPFVYELGEYGECDVTCGEGMQTRTVQCFQRGTMTMVPLNLCAEPVPPTTRICSEEPCPSCDQTIMTDMSFVASPNNPLPYENSQNCVYNITNPDGECVNLIFLSFELEPGTTSSVCDTDSLIIEDGEIASIKSVYCGLQTSIPEWRSRSSTALLTFNSDNENVFSGFNVYASFVDCPIFGFVASAWSVCDAGCGGGTQTRTVQCVRLETDDMVDDDVCSDPKPALEQPCNEEECPTCDATIDTDKYTLLNPDAPNPYERNYNCDFSYINPDGDCMVLFFLSVDLPPPNEFGICDQDYLVIEDLSENPVSFTYCGDESPPQFSTRGSEARVTFVSDNNGTVPYDGFTIYSSFTTCPLFGFTVGEFGECDRECGGGMQTRPVQCVLFSSGMVVSESTCIDQKPATTQACNTEPCPSCDQLITETNSDIQSPNYPLTYDPDRTCVYTIINPDDCVRLTFLDFNLPQGPDENMCITDFVKIADLGIDYLNQTLCGGIDENFSWESRTGNVEVTLQTGPMPPMGSNFRLYVGFDDCPVNGYVAGEFGACSQTCGIGVRTRTVECQNLMSGTVVDESNCPEMKPPTTEICEDVDCPSCDESFTTSTVVRSLDPFGPNRRCVYDVTNPNSDQCITLITLRLELDEENENGTCDVSSVTFQDGNNPALSTTLCGNPSSLPSGWTSTSNEVNIIFETGATANQTGDMGWEVFPTFVDCPRYGFVAGPWQMCSASCEGGTQMRVVECQNLDTNGVVDAAFCASLPMLPSSQPCNEINCPIECGLLFDSASGETTLQSPGYGYGYQNDQDCTNTVLNTNGCIILTFLDLSIEEGTTPLVCDKDYVEISDANYAEYTERYCGNDVPSGSWRSQGPLARVKFVSDGSVVDEGFNIFYTFTASCPTADYVVGDWNECSVTCGGGVEVRSVSCRNARNQVVANSNCPGATPPVSQACNWEPCADYVIGEWSNCTTECDGGNRTRNVTCQAAGVVVDDAECEGTKPIEIEECNTEPCAVLTVGNWSECSTTCGDGIQTRELNCTAEGVEVDISQCDEASNYNTTQVCNVQTCPTFVTSAYGECPATCGQNNFQTRNVTCENDVAVFNDSACDGTKPVEMTECNNRTCNIICGDSVDTSVVVSGNFSVPYPFSGNYSDGENCTISFTVATNFLVQFAYDTIDIAFAANPQDCTTQDYIEWNSGGTNTQICAASDANSLNAQSDTTFTFISNNDGTTGAGVLITFTAFDTSG